MRVFKSFKEFEKFYFPEDYEREKLSKMAPKELACYYADKNIQDAFKILEEENDR